MKIAFVICVILSLASAESDCPTKIWGTTHKQSDCSDDGESSEILLEAVINYLYSCAEQQTFDFSSVILKCDQNGVTIENFN